MTSPPFGFFLCHVEIMARDTHDNDDLNPWTSIGLQTNLILNRLRCDAQIRELMKIDEQKQEQSEGKRQSGAQDNQRADEHAKYVEQRLRDYAAFERRASGKND
jgi:hypothetical protein